MRMPRKLLFLGVMLLACHAGAAEPKKSDCPKPEGIADRVGDVIMNCSGGASNPQKAEGVIPPTYSMPSEKKAAPVQTRSGATGSSGKFNYFRKKLNVPSHDNFPPGQRPAQHPAERSPNSPQGQGEQPGSSTPEEKPPYQLPIKHGF